jgi:hypothetical protein
MIEIKSIKEILKYDNLNTLIVIDIDNTLIQSENINYGSVEWCSHAIKKYGFIFGLSKWQHVLTSNDDVKMVSIEKDVTKEAFLNIKYSPVILCTKRSKFLKDVTFKHLKHIIPLNLLTNIPLTENEGCKILTHGYFINGIIFCDLESKIDCLEWFVSNHTNRVNQVIVVDDTPFLKDVQTLCENVTIQPCKYIKTWERAFNQNNFINFGTNKFTIFEYGKMGSGKDLFFEYLVKIFGENEVGKIRIADPLKELCAKFTLSTLENNYNNKDFVSKEFASIDQIIKDTTAYLRKNMIVDSITRIRIEAFASLFKTWVDNKKTSLGQCQQKVGMAFRALFGKDIWLKDAALQLKNSKYRINVVVDGRLKNEANFFKLKHKAVLIRLERYYELREGSFGKRDPNHISETDLDDYQFQFKFVNNGTKEELFKRMVYLFKDKN